MTENKEKPHYVGHRQRLRDKFLLNMGEDLADYELLELVLFYLIPRKDVKPISKDLIKKFGSFSKVINANISDLILVDGIQETTAIGLKLLKSSNIRLLKQDIENKEDILINSFDVLIDYCRATIASEGSEITRVLFLDSKNKLIKDEVQNKGTINQTAIYAREVVKRALDLGSSAIILTHNHPSGDVTPSKNDVDITKKIFEACRAFDIILHDHIVISKNNYYSFKEMGKL